jgi:hypothetical protein
MVEELYKSMIWSVLSSKTLCCSYVEFKGMDKVHKSVILNFMWHDQYPFDPNNSLVSNK